MEKVHPSHWKSEDDLAVLHTQRGFLGAGSSCISHLIQNASNYSFQSKIICLSFYQFYTKRMGHYKHVWVYIHMSINSNSKEDRIFSFLMKI